MISGSIIGVGNTATVYDWEPNKVIKLFNSGYPKNSVEREYHNAVVLQDKKFSKPLVYDLIKVDNQYGIVYDKLQGESLLDSLLQTQNINESAKILADLHQEILQNDIQDVPDYKDFLRHNLERVSWTSLKEKEKIFHMLNALPDGTTLCHGDFHPGNVILTPEKPVVIDFMNICRGDYYYDVARTVFLIEYTPVPPIPGDVETLKKLKMTLADAYLKYMKVTRDEISKVLPVIIASRAGE
jgi:Ser/Thr protein kinase RdoA (MazF antagonist)